MLASQNMRQDQIWGTDIEIVVAAAMFHVFIIVQANQGGRPTCSGDPRNQPIFLLNQHNSQGQPFHYKWMRRN
jgi:hypothetical protein